MKDKDLEETLTHLTKDLVGFQTVHSDDSEIELCLDYIRDYFSEDEFQIKNYCFNGFESVLIGFNDIEDPEILLHGHIDVINAEKEQFSPEVKDEKIYGRGTADMKGGVACLMKLMKDLKQKKPSVSLLIVTDEERGGKNGAKKLFKDKITPSFGITAEPNNTDGYMKIITEQKGVLRLKITALGKSAHGSKPWEGKNAAEKLIRKYPEIRKLFKNERGWNTTINLGKLNSGKSINQVPSEATASVDIRVTEQYNIEEILRDIEKIGGINYEILSKKPPLSNKDSKYISNLLKKSSTVISDLELGRKEPSSDMCYLSEQGVPAVVFGPEGYNVHGQEEYIVIESMKDYYKGIYNFLEQY